MSAIYGYISADFASISGMRNLQPSLQTGSVINKTLPNKLPTNLKVKENKPKKTRHRWYRRHKFLTTILILCALIIGAGAWFGSGIIGNLDKVFHGNIFSDVEAIFSTTPLKGESQGRVNILLAGYQGKQSDEGDITDSIMVVSLDTKNNTAFTMSIPRDLWVHIPGVGYQKINDANDNSSFDTPGYFKGGMGQLQEIIEQDFHIPIDYYALIDYNAFKDAVNAVGGITVDIQSPNPKGLYDPNVNKAHGGPLRLPNGPVHLDGMQALALALARGDSPYAYGFPLSDINRTQHQRQMLIALEEKASSIGFLSNPLDITRLVNAMGNNVKTNLSLAEVLALTRLAKKLKPNDISSYGLSYGGKNPLLTTYLAPDGEDALIPRAGIFNYSQIQKYYQTITNTN